MAGRAGRDGKKSDCFLMYSPSGIVKQKYIISQNVIDNDRRKIQNENLQILVNYCHTNNCSRKEIINYFGEESEIDLDYDKEIFDLFTKKRYEIAKEKNVPPMEKFSLKLLKNILVIPIV